MMVEYKDGDTLHMLKHFPGSAAPLPPFNRFAHPGKTTVKQPFVRARTSAPQAPAYVDQQLA